MTYAQLEARIVAWAEAQPDVRAVIAVGSTARGDADGWSDLDLIMFTADRARYLDPAWLATFGTVWLTYLDEAAPGDPEWFAIYEDGLKVDIVLLPVTDPSEELPVLLRGPHYQTVFARGVRVLFDRHGSPRVLPPEPVPIPAPPSNTAFDQVVNGFLLESVTTAKFIARGDFWRAHLWFAHDLRPRLLKLIEWHAYGRDTWYDGRFIDVWADPRALAALPGSFALYDRESVHAALTAMLDLFELLGQEAATRFGYAYPSEAHRKIAHLIDSILGEA